MVMSVLARQQARRLGQFTTPRVPSRGRMPAEPRSFPKNHSPFRTSHWAQRAPLRTRGGADTRLQTDDRVCNVATAWPLAATLVLADSSVTGLESATAGQSVRRFQATTGHSARWHQTVSEVFSTAPRTPGALGAQCHAARITTSRPRYNDAEGDKVLRPPFLRERRGCARVCARMAHVDCMQLGDMQLADGHVMIVLCSKRASQRFSRSWGRASCWGLTARGSVPCSCKRELHAAQAEAQRCGLGWTASRRFGGAASEGLGDSCSRVECRGSGGRSRCAGSALSV